MRTRRSGAAVDDLADAVDVALHEVAAEPVAAGARALEVHGSPGCSAPRVVRAKVSSDDVGLPPVPRVAPVDDGEAAAVDRDRVAELHVVEHACALMRSRPPSRDGDACRAPRRCR